MDDLKSRAFEEWYVAARPRLIVALGGIGAPTDVATELVDEAMILVWQHWSEVAEMSAPQGWAFIAARNLWFNRRRRNAVELRFVSGIGRDAAENRGDDYVVEFQSLISALPRRHRQVLVLRYVLQMTEPEIATTLGVPRGTVSSRLRRAHRQVRAETHANSERVDRSFVTPEPA